MNNQDINEIYSDIAKHLTAKKENKFFLLFASLFLFCSGVGNTAAGFLLAILAVASFKNSTTPYAYDFGVLSLGLGAFAVIGGVFLIGAAVVGIRHICSSESVQEIEKKKQLKFKLREIMTELGTLRMYSENKTMELLDAVPHR